MRRMHSRRLRVRGFPYGRCARTVSRSDARPSPFRPPSTSAPIRRTSVFRPIGCRPGTALYASSMSRTSNRAANSRSHSAPANAPMLKLLEFLQDTFPDRHRCAQSNRRCCAGYPPRTRPYGWLIAVPGVGYGIRIRTFALIDGIKRAETARCDVPCRPWSPSPVRPTPGHCGKDGPALPRCLAAQPHG